MCRVRAASCRNHAVAERWTASVTPRPNQGRPRMPRRETPRSPTSSDNSYRPEFPPFAPDPPEPVPLSPTFTSSSSQTLNSSQTSYSSEFMAPQQTLVHWAQRIFDGQHPESEFSGAYQLYILRAIISRRCANLWLGTTAPSATESPTTLRWATCSPRALCRR